MSDFFGSLTSTFRLPMIALLGAAAFPTTLVASALSGCGDGKSGQQLPPTSSALLIPGDDYSPQAVRPNPDQQLPPTRAYLLWKDGDIPTGRQVTGYQVCSTTEDASAISGESQCPNSLVVQDPHTVLGDLKPKATHHWKVRTLFDGGAYSQYSALQTFSTDTDEVPWEKPKQK